MSTTKALRNPAHPHALTTNDAHYNVWFQLYHANGDVQFAARFIEAANLGKDILLSNRRGADFRLGLYELGLTPNAEGEWNGTYCLRLEGPPR